MNFAIGDPSHAEGRWQNVHAFLNGKPLPGNDPKVAGLVHITAFALDNGESVSSLIKDPPPGARVPPILPPQDGFAAVVAKLIKDASKGVNKKPGS